MNVIEQRVKIFLEAWNQRDGEIYETASCQACGRVLVRGKFDMVGGVLICLECQGKEQVEVARNQLQLAGRIIP
jgi:formylmethanofuran dehydrogenase subunit E